MLLSVRCDISAAAENFPWSQRSCRFGGSIRGMIFMLGFLAMASAHAVATQPVHYGLFGDVHVAMPSGEVRRSVMLISDRDGWSARSEALAQALSDDGALVMGIDLPVYLKQLYSIKNKCAYPSGHFEELSDWMQRHQGLANFTNPLLVGDSAGATFAYAVAAQAPAGTFSGLATLGWDSDFRAQRSICGGDAGAMAAADGAHGWRIVPVRKLPPMWLPQPYAPDARVTGIVEKIGATFSALAQFRHGNVSMSAKAAAVLFATQVAAWQDKHTAAVLPDDVADLPLVEVPHQGNFAGRVAIILSGDGGWAGLDIAVADQMAQRGIDVIGLSTIKFFWHTRKPEEAADALTRIIQHYGETRPGADFVVIGYSFGASLAPVVINRAPLEIQNRISAQVLISPDPEAVFEVKVGDWFGSVHHDGSIPLAPEIAKTKVRVICVRGKEEGADSFCAQLAGKPKVSILELPGGHHYDGDYDGLGLAIFNALK
jgi:type IV secretory pathway VirJ component